jgi:hypothetical protein
VYSVRFAGLSGTLIVVPSIAVTSSPAPRHPRGGDADRGAAQQIKQEPQKCAADAAASLRQHARGRDGHIQAVQPRHQPMPHL